MNPSEFYVSSCMCLKYNIQTHMWPTESSGFVHWCCFYFFWCGQFWGHRSNSPICARHGSASSSFVWESVPRAPETELHSPDSCFLVLAEVTPGLIKCSCTSSIQPLHTSTDFRVFLGTHFVLGCSSSENGKGWAYSSKVAQQVWLYVVLSWWSLLLFRDGCHFQWRTDFWKL